MYIFALIFSLSLFLGVNLTGCGTSGKAGPFVVPTAEPTVEPTDEPTGEPTVEPTGEPTDEPTDEPTGEPTDEPTDEPTAEPTDEPTSEPTDTPTETPTEEPTRFTETELTGIAYDGATNSYYVDEASWLGKWGYTSEWYNDDYLARLYKDGREVSEFDIPETFEYEGDSYVIVAVDFRAMAHCAVSKITIPDSVTKIAYAAFEYCTILTELTVPDSVTEIDDMAFFYCESVSSIKLSDNLRSIGEYAFAYTHGLTGSLILPDSVKNIGECAFYESEISSITLPDGLEFIGPDALQKCSNLGSVTWKGTTYTDKDQFNAAVKAAGIASEDVWTNA